MTLKAELTKLIDTKKDKLRSRDAAHGSFWQVQKERFLPLKKALEEIVIALDFPELSSKFTDDKAVLVIADNEWEISPYFTTSLHVNEGESLFQPAPGFTIKKHAIYHFLLDEEEDISELHFSDAEELLTYITEQLATDIAAIQHRRGE